MNPLHWQTSSRLLRVIVRPLAYFSVRHGVKFQQLQELLKSALIEAAESELQRTKTKTTSSKLSIVTGLQRRDIERLRGKKAALNDERDLIRKIIGSWQARKEFITRSGDPKVLTVGFEGSEFSSLVQSVSKDLNPATILYELLRLRIAGETPKGVKLMLQSFSPRSDVTGGFEVIAKDCDDLLRVGEHNLLSGLEPPHLHVRTSYDKIRTGELETIKKWILKEGHKFHAKIRSYLSRFDQDITPRSKYRGPLSQVSVTSFARTENTPSITVDVM